MAKASPRFVALIRLLAVTTIAVSIAACDAGDRAPTQVPGFRRASLGNRFHPQVAVRTIREELRDLSIRYPGFTGVSLDSARNVVISVAVDDFPASSRSAIFNWARAQAPEIASTAEIRLRRVPFDYASLYEGYKKILEEVRDEVGVSQTYIDEVAGRVVIAGVDEAAMQRIRAAVTRADAPAEMTVVARSPYAVTDATLWDTIRGILPGTQIVREDSIACTLGPTAHGRDENGQADFSQGFFLTSSHCSTQRGVLDSTVFGQPFLSSPIGFEVADAPVYSGGGCPHSQCQDVDVAIFQVYDSLVSGMAWAFAAKSSPVGVMVPPTPPPYNGVQNIVGAVFGGAFVGTTVHKVGRTTGETSGIVFASCVDVRVATSSLFITCTEKTGYNASHGDSGSPVWVPFDSTDTPGATPNLAGVHWGEITPGDTGLFSRIDLVMLVFNTPALAF